MSCWGTSRVGAAWWLLALRGVAGSAGGRRVAGSAGGRSSAGVLGCVLHGGGVVVLMFGGSASAAGITCITSGGAVFRFIKFRKNLGIFGARIFPAPIPWR